MSESNEGVPHVVFNYDAPTAEEHEFEACLGAIYLECPEPVADDVNRIVRARIAKLAQANAALEAQLAEARKERDEAKTARDLFVRAVEKTERELHEAKKINNKIFDSREDLKSEYIANTHELCAVEEERDKLRERCAKLEEAIQLFQEWTQSADGPYPSVINKASEIFDAALSALPQEGDGK